MPNYGVVDQMTLTRAKAMERGTAKAHAYWKKTGAKKMAAGTAKANKYWQSVVASKSGSKRKKK